MAKRAFIIHGWGGNPQEAWLPWLKGELEKTGFAVTVPEMPETDSPDIAKWVEKLAAMVGEPDNQTYLIGHSIGCQTILRYLEKLPEENKIGGAVFVAGWFHLPNLATAEEGVIARPWLETKINLPQVRKRSQNFVAIFSDDDPDVPLSDKEIFATGLGARIVVERSKGHFTADDGVMTLPSALEAVLAFS